jgi:hypothetical protein
MKDKTWTDKFSEEDTKFLADVEVMSGNLISQVYIFIDLFHQYIDLVQSAAIFSPDFAEPEQNDANVSPTQTFPDAPANRAERRAKKTPLQVISKQVEDFEDDLR